MLEHALALFFANYNWCWIHPVLRKTPTQAAGLVDEPWTFDDLLKKAVVS